VCCRGRWSFRVPSWNLGAARSPIGWSGPFLGLETVMASISFMPWTRPIVRSDIFDGPDLTEPLGIWRFWIRAPRATSATVSL